MNRGRNRGRMRAVLLEHHLRVFPMKITLTALLVAGNLLLSSIAVAQTTATAEVTRTIPVQRETIEMLDEPPENMDPSKTFQMIRGGSEHHLVVRIAGALPATGTVEISLFKNDEFYLKQPYLQNSGPLREDGTFNALFNELAEGEYAVVVVHDANDNQKLDTGFLGFGGESYAYSQNVQPWFGRPDFEDIAVTVSGSTQIEISLE